MKKRWIGLAAGGVAVAGIAIVASSIFAQPLFDRSDTAEQAAVETQILPAIQAPDSVIVDAIVMPEREASLSMASSGLVADVMVAEGQFVESGAPLVQLSQARQAAAVAQAEANLKNAELKLAELSAPPRNAEVARYQAAVTAAQASLQKVLDGPSDADLTGAQVELANAQAALRQAQSDYDEVSWRNDISMLPQATALEQATNNYVAAQARYDDIAAGSVQADITNAGAQVSSAQADLNLLLAGAQEESIAAAEANVEAARAALSDAQAALNDMTLRAPFAGTVAAVNVEVGEQVSPGNTVVQLADLSNWRIETDDLTELNVVNVQPGDRVEIAIDALPEAELSGRVTHIKPIGENKQGDITFTVMVELDEQDERLRWNMTAQTTIVPDELGRAAAKVPAAIRQVTPTDFEAAAAASETSEGNTTQATVDATEVDDEIVVETVAETMATIVTNGANLNVRSGPGPDYAVISSAAPGESFRVVDSDDGAGWIQIALAGGETGWVSANFVTLDGVAEEVSASFSEVQQGQPLSQGQAALISFGVETSEPVAAAFGSTQDGTLVFQSSSGGTIYVYDLASGALNELTYGMDPDISPDGQTVAFVRNGGEHGLYLIGIDGNNERRIFSGGERLRAPSWSPEGDEIVFSRFTGQFECRQVGLGLCYPDSKFLHDFPLIGKDEFALSKVDVNGQNFTDLPSLTTAVAPEWSENGIVYQSSSGIQRTSDGPNAVDQSIAASHKYGDPDWQLEGDRIVFQSLEGNHRELVSINADGGDQRFLTGPTNLLASEYPQNVAPVWSPDGEQIAFLSNRTEDGNAGDWTIWIMDADGSDQQQLPIDVEIAYDFQGEQVLSW